MVEVSQAPSGVDLRCVSGEPFVVTVTLQDSAGVALSGVSSPVVGVWLGAQRYPSLAPTVSNQSAGVVVVSWTAPHMSQRS